MAHYLGIDTSNYRTSAALFDSQTHTWKNSGRLLEVPEGRIGLRQSDALFQHTLHLPERVQALPSGFADTLAAVAASTRPRAVEGSYMPCFLCGKGTARAIAHAADVPCYEVSHQQGHLAAAALSAGALELLREPFLAWHLSGGTTELLLVKPSEETGLPEAQIIGGTTDVAAGQIIDRAGNLLGLTFPSGAELEQLANTCKTVEKPFRPKVTDSLFSLSGVQNKIEALHEAGAEAATVARFAIDTIAEAVLKATAQAKQNHPLPVLCAGGVMANQSLQQAMHQRFGAKFAQPELSGDNAVGVAVLAALLHEGKL
ncbi:MAG: DNA-binding protein [Eubacteriales bacterium]|nr:DNA-binding protein [Eubacteriales bacterium]